MAASKAVELWLANAPSPRIESGTSGRFEAEALPHLNDIFRTATRILGQKERADDVAQEVFLQAWKSFDRFEPGTNCRAWLFKILFHVIQHHRRKSFRLKLVDEGDEIFEQTLIYEPPVPQDLTDEDVRAAFQKLPQQYREVV